MSVSLLLLTLSYLFVWTSCQSTSQYTEATNGTFLGVYAGTPITWQEARSYCQNLGGDLATINSGLENIQAYSAALSAGADGDIWIGLNDIAIEGTFVWADGSDVIYTNWLGGEPNDFDTGEDCTHLDFGNAQWNDLPCDPLTDIGRETSTAFVCLGAGPTDEPTPDPTPSPTQLTTATLDLPATTDTPTIKYDCDGSTVDPEPLIYWNFDDVSGTASRRGLNLFHNGAFDISMYDGDWRTPRDDPYDSTAGGPYLDGNGRLICQGVDGGGVNTRANYIALSDSTIPFEVSGSKTYVVYGNTLNLDNVGGALMSIDSRFIQLVDGVDIAYIEQQFDALVYNEFGRTPGSAEWVADSEGNMRTNFNAWSSFEETGAVYDSSTGEYNGIASFVLVYDEDEHTGEVYVTLYRNCERLGSYNSGNDTLFDVQRNSGRFAFCQRHVDAVSETDTEFVIEYAAFYDYALSEDEVAGVCQCSNNGGDSSVKNSKSRKDSNNNYGISGLIGNHVDYVTVVAVIAIGLVFVMLVRIFMRKNRKDDKDGYIAIGEEKNGECSVKIDNYNSIVSI